MTVTRFKKRYFFSNSFTKITIVHASMLIIILLLSFPTILTCIQEVKESPLVMTTYYYEKAQALSFYTPHKKYFQDSMKVNVSIDAYLDIELASEMISMNYQNNNLPSYIKKLHNSTFRETRVKICGIFAFLVSKNSHDSLWNVFTTKEKTLFVQDMFNAAKNLHSGLNIIADTKVIRTPSCHNKTPLIRSHLVATKAVSGESFKLLFAYEKKAFEYETLKFIDDEKNGLEYALAERRSYLNASTFEKPITSQKIVTNSKKYYTCNTAERSRTFRCYETNSTEHQIGRSLYLNNFVALPSPEENALDDKAIIEEALSETPLETVTNKASTFVFVGGNGSHSGNSDDYSGSTYSRAATGGGVVAAIILNVLLHLLLIR